MIHILEDSLVIYDGKSDMPKRGRRRLNPTLQSCSTSRIDVTATLDGSAYRTSQHWRYAELDMDQEAWHDACTIEDVRLTSLRGKFHLIELRTWGLPTQQGLRIRLEKALEDDSNVKLYRLRTSSELGHSDHCSPAGLLPCNWVSRGKQWLSSAYLRNPSLRLR